MKQTRARLAEPRNGAVNMPDTRPKPLAIALCAILVCACSKQPANQENAPEARSLAVHFLQPMFDTLDCEGVGIIEAGEVDEHYHGFFKSADRDTSRTLSKEEYIRSLHRPEPALDRIIFSSMDADGDQQVSHEEFRNYTVAAVATADTNQNGELTEEEAEMYNWRIPVKP